MEFTKLSNISWAADWIRPIGWIERRDQKLAEMVSRGLTDGHPIIISPLETHRRWTNEAAAQEFIDFTKSMLVEFNVQNAQISEASITDIIL